MNDGLTTQQRYRRRHPDRVAAYAEQYRASGRAAEPQRQHRAMKRSAVSMLKMEAGCVDCGYNAHPFALDFDHVEGKSAGIGDMISRNASIERLLFEIERCVVRCANCHRIKTAERVVL